MKTKLLLFFFCFSVLGSMGQVPYCIICLKPVSQCPYKGKHYIPEPPPDPRPKITPRPKPRVTATYQNEVLRVGNVSYRMKYVSGGTFTMGATSEMENPNDDEKPTHKVKLSSY